MVSSGIKKRVKSDPYQTLNVGHPKKWTESQWKIIDGSLPEWHQISLIENPDLDGRNPLLQNWKKTEANRLLAMEEFKVLPMVVSVYYLSSKQLTHGRFTQFKDNAEARKCIIRKFTNYRNKQQMKMATAGEISDVKLYEAQQKAAAAILDWRACSKGKAAFARRMETEIMQRRDEIYKDENEDNHPLIACYQMALKEMWKAADHAYWESQALGDAEDISR